MKFYFRNFFFLFSFSAFGQEVEWVIEPKYEFQTVGETTEGLTVVKKNNKFGFVNKLGEIVIPIIYNEAHSFSEGLALVSLNKKEYFIDTFGNIIIESTYDYVFDFSDGLALVKKDFDNSDSKFGYIDKTGLLKIPLIYEASDQFSDGLATFMNKNGKYGYLDKNGKIIIPAMYDHAWTFSEGLAIVLIGENSWVIDKKNKKILNLNSFSQTGDYFFDGILSFEKNDNTGFINRFGKEVIPALYTFPMQINSKRVSAGNGFGLNALLDTEGKKLTTFKYIQINDFNGGIASAQLKDKIVYIDTLGREFENHVFEYGLSFSEGQAWVKLNGKWGIIKNPILKKEEKISPKIIPNAANQIFWKTDPHTSKNNTATIKSIISGNDIKPDQIKLLVNGKSQSGQKLGESSLKGKHSRYNWQGVVSLQEGENEIVLAIQQSNQAEVLSEPLIIRYEEPTKPNLYIVSVGVKGLGLKYTPNDAQKIADVFRTQKGKLFGQVNIGTYNQEQNTTAESLRNVIGELSSISITPNDVLIVFVSAHGEKIDKQDGKTDFAVLTSNFNSTNIFTKVNTSLLYESHIIEYLKPIDCKKLILLDACHSGQATEQNIGGAKTRYLQDLQEAQEVVKRTPSGIITIASTSGELLSYEDDLWQNGAFTKALVDGLNGKADTNGDRYIYVGELYDYIEKTVPIIVNQEKKQRQEPKIYPIDLPTEKDFPIFKY